MILQKKKELKYICPICYEKEHGEYFEEAMLQDTEAKLCEKCLEKVKKHNETHKDDKICEICGFPFHTEDEWVKICPFCQEDIKTRNHSLDVRSEDYFRNVDGRIFFKPKQKGDICKIKCVDCGRTVTVEVYNTKTERCEECTLLRTRKMNRLRKQKQRAKSVIK